METVPKAMLAPTLTSANCVRENTTANYALNLNPAQKEVPTPPPTSANLLHQPNNLSITTPIQIFWMTFFLLVHLTPLNATFHCLLFMF